MLKISDAVEEIFRSNHYLEYGIYHDILNVAQVAKFIRKFIQVRVKKKLSNEALQMAISRYKDKLQKNKKIKDRTFHVTQISTLKDLRMETHPRTPATHKFLQQFYNNIISKSGYCGITEGFDEITTVFEEKYAEHTANLKPKFIFKNIGAVYLQFSPEYLEFPGMIHHIVHILMTQGINILEIASTSTSIVIYLSKDDIKLAFNTLYDRLFS